MSSSESLSTIAIRVGTLLRASGSSGDKALNDKIDTIRKETMVLLSAINKRVDTLKRMRDDDDDAFGVVKSPEEVQAAFLAVRAEVLQKIDDACAAIVSHVSRNRLKEAIELALSYGEGDCIFFSHGCHAHGLEIYVGDSNVLSYQHDVLRVKFEPQTIDYDKNRAAIRTALVIAFKKLFDELVPFQNYFVGTWSRQRRQ